MIDSGNYLSAFNTLAELEKLCPGDPEIDMLRTEFVSCVKGGQANCNIGSLIDEFSVECKNNIEYKLKVLFVAELGGKWDSMDSVYHAFMKRDDCEVDVVIEPVFRQQTGADGITRREVICEDFLTPMGINNIPYQNYDIEKTAPDMTFISQPYESCTIPTFWPENISKVSRLVYLPYYCAITMKKEGFVTFNAFKNMNVQKYSWKIACQSEQMKKYYVEYDSNRGENVLVTGLPKWDYVLQHNKDNTPCPNNWKKKINGRKVFLWNNHYTDKYQGININDMLISKKYIFIF